MKFLNENNDLFLFNESEAKKLFFDICEKDVWQSAYTSELICYGLLNAPILLSQIRKDLNISLDVSDESLEEEMEEIGLCLSVPFENGRKTFPVGGNIALSCLMQRAGFGTAPVLSNYKEKKSVSAMGVEDKATVLNYGLNQFKNKSLVLIRDEKVRAIHSGDEGDYQPLRFDKLNETLCKELNKQFASCFFNEAVLNHQFFSVLYLIRDYAIETQLKDIFLKSGINLGSKIQLGCRLTSSDVGLFGANIYPYVVDEFGTYRPIGLPIKTEHRNKASLEMFESQAKKVYALLRDSGHVLDAMSKKRVNHPSGIVQRLGKTVGLPKKLVVVAAEDFKSSFMKPTQLDVYWKLFEILEEAKFNGKVSPAQGINIEEFLARLIFGNMDDFDMPFNWE